GGRGAARRKPAARVTQDAASNSDFQSAVGQIRVAATQQRTHPRTDTKRVQVEKSALPTVGEQKDQGSKQHNAGEMGKAGQEGLSNRDKFSAKDFKEALLASV